MIQLTILGQIPSKSNGYRCVKSGNRCRIVKSYEVRKYENSSYIQILEQTSRLKKPVIQGYFCYSAKVYYKSFLSDLDGHFKVVWDILQKTQIIENDRYCKLIENVEYLKDKENPRIELTIKQYG